MKTRIVSLTMLRDLGCRHRPKGDKETRGPRVPNFILWAEADHCIQHNVVIVETMGFADDVYRDRKHRTDGLTSWILREAPVVAYDFWFQPALASVNVTSSSGLMRGG